MLKLLGLYPEVRPQAVYDRSLELLRRVKEINPHIVTKSGLMLGLGETADELAQTMADIRDTGCDLLTLGQVSAADNRASGCAAICPSLRI
jgi:lipoic acid synthetase